MSKHSTASQLPVSSSTLGEVGEQVHTARKRAVEQDGYEVDDSTREPLCDREQAVVEDLTDTHGWERLGTGAGRVVFDVGDDVAVKFPRYGDTPLSNGVAQNTREVRLFREFGGDLRLLPVLDAAPGEKWWVAMPRVEPVGESHNISDYGSDVLSPLNELVDELLPLADEIHSPEVNPANVAYYKGRLHVFDYGRSPIPLDSLE